MKGFFVASANESVLSYLDFYPKTAITEETGQKTTISYRSLRITSTTVRPLRSSVGFCLGAIRRSFCIVS